MDSTARQVPPGRLAHFEDDEDLRPPPTLPPRRTASRPQRTPADDARPAPQPAKPASKASPIPKPAPATPTVKKPTAPKKKPTATAGSSRPSNVHVPEDLVDKVAKARRDTGRSTGEVIIAAIESTYPKLSELIRPPETTGTTLFTPRPSRAVRTQQGRLSPLSYRLDPQDFEVIDRLVAETGAASRGHLITVALTAYLSATT